MPVNDRNAAGIRPLEEMVATVRDEKHCRRLPESMVWPDGRACPACGYKRPIAIAGRDKGKRRARSGIVSMLNRRLRVPAHRDNARLCIRQSFLNSGRS